MNRNLLVPFELKSVAEGTFTGYASVFGNVDLGMDVIEPGAFKRIVKDSDGKVPVYYWHGMRDGGSLPLGRALVEQDEKGLAVDGELVMDDPFVQRVHTHMRAKTVRGMSIGYNVLQNGAVYDDKGVRHLKSLELVEVSILPRGMNPKARVTGVKSELQRVETIREFEDLLRDAGGFSVRQARAIAESGFKALQTVRDEPGGVTEQQVAELIEGRLFNLGNPS